ncbi:hypothetical protein MEN41_11965 [Dolichospermum sp. ST_con]|nr:hypothetical protein [Dolichospermum sp. ST_con]MDD1417847.1 hypothetical protein [Dolichospermum sp. ST_sed1]MDD1423098.1 hypothetical protein [Dolichospermum sp. ST_sed9]MDD1429841.1 hypothetical protein [Dolichospermum sp. ST_sed6]MDD1439063.1 hypothetical protein [Dolichospermum sp. ST_sed3]MDD1447309.1 hypothetical protein [Dolichospermum sp. ST_sed8]MDD1454769.1 hypothetical protein [Dolichospermum sp. ST_sed7]MDD1459900.1 hypothetical protein [Dolichospermum sp. ST_sed2]MDD1471637
MLDVLSVLEKLDVPFGKWTQNIEEIRAIARAEIIETSCSPERPPNSKPTLNLVIFFHISTDMQFPL